MRTLVIDFETFFDQHFSLKKLPALAYVRSPKFKVHGAAVKVDDQPTEWVTGAELPRFFRTFNWPHVRVVMHNSNFDNLILVEQYGCIAGELVDTLGLCRALLPSDMDFNLDALGKLFDIGGKTGGGDALLKAKGLYTLPQALEDELAEYAIQDVDITKTVFDQLYPAMPGNERRALDLVTRLSTVGLVKGDPEGFEHTRQEILDDRYTKLEAAGVDDPATLRSRDKFAELLKAQDIDPPTKISATTGERTWAFSKQDVEFVRLKADEQAGPLVEAKLAWTSNTAISRCERLTEISKRAPHTLPMQLNFSGAHTHRLSGGGGVNMQNLPARGLGSSIRKAFVAPPGHVICVADLSGIELRMSMWFCGEWPMVKLLGSGGDSYIVEAARQFKKPESEVTKRERQYGKVVQLGCFAEDTEVLVWSNGKEVPSYKRISSVTTEDWLWDGVEWVQHQGLVNQGVQETIELSGIRVTPDHKMWCGNRWESAQALAQNENTRFQALETASACLPSQVTNSANGEACGTSLFNAIATPRSTGSAFTTCAEELVKAAMFALSELLDTIKSSIKATPISSLTIPTEAGCSTASQPASIGAITPTIPATQTTVGGESKFTSHGVTDVQGGGLSWPTSLLSMAGTCRVWSSTVSTSTATTSLETCALSPKAKTQEIDALFESCSSVSKSSKKKTRVYDLAFAGPRNRFTILTNEGHLVVHNCGYGMGADKFRKLAGTGPMGMPPMYLTESEARNTITNYRQGVPKVTAMWRWLNDVALQVLAYKDMQPVDCGPVQIAHNRIRLPNGLDLHYPNVEITEDGASWGVNGKQHYIYGGIMLENIIQALAGTLVKQQMVEIDRRLDGANFVRNGTGKGAVVHQVHDEILTICREEDADEVLSTMYEVMRIQPDWAPNLPLDVEGGWGTYYIDK